MVHSPPRRAPRHVQKFAEDGDVFGARRKDRVSYQPGKVYVSFGKDFQTSPIQPPMLSPCQDLPGLHRLPSLFTPSELAYLSTAPPRGTSPGASHGCSSGIPRLRKAECLTRGSWLMGGHSYSSLLIPKAMTLPQWQMCLLVLSIRATEDLSCVSWTPWSFHRKRWPLPKAELLTRYHPETRSSPCS